MTARVCEVCGSQFESKRSTARYCSDRCRQRAHRRGPAQEVLVAAPSTHESTPEERAPTWEERFGEEPPGPGRWERSDAFGWVEAEAPAPSPYAAAWKERLASPALPAQAGTVAPVEVDPSQPLLIWSAQYGKLVELDADGRLIPPTD